MKTIEDIASSRYISDLELPERKRIHPSCYIDWAVFGAREAQRWIPIEKEVPVHDSWVLVKTDLCRFPCQVAQFRLDKFISTDNFIVANVSFWRPIDRQ